MNYAIETGLRGLRRHPRTMILSIVTLALGLASVMTMLSLLAMLSADPLPGLSQHLYLGWVDSREAPKNRTDPSTGDPNYLWKTADVEAMFAAQPQVPQTAVVTSFFNLTSADGRKTVDSANGVAAIGPFGAMFGVPLLHGRFWTPTEERSRARVIVLNRDVSVRLFGTANGVGHQVRLGDGLFQVIGIAAHWQPRPRFYFMQPGNAGWRGDGEAVFVPAQAALEANTPMISARFCDDTDSDGYHFSSVNQTACRWVGLWAELQSPRQVDSYRAALFRYAQDRHAAGAFQRPAHADLYSVMDWPDGGALGSLLHGSDGDGAYRVIGIVRHLLRYQMSELDDGKSEYSMLIPTNDAGTPILAYVVRTDPAQRAAIKTAIPAVIKRTFGQTLLRGIEPAVADYEHLRALAFQSRRASVWLLAVVNLVVAAITGIGIASLTGYWIAQRTRQIGVRRALGATRGQILRYFLTENFLLVGAGLVLGMLLAYAINQLLMHYYALPRLPLIYLPIGAVLLWALGQLAVLGPARRAAAIEPAIATRSA